MPYSDPEQQRAANRAYQQRRRASNPERVAEIRSDHEARNRAWLNGIKESTPCADCGELGPHYLMHFDHLPQFQKHRNVMSMCRYSRASIEAELAKCEVTCVRCHHARTHHRRVAKKAAARRGVPEQRSASPAGWSRRGATRCL